MRHIFINIFSNFYLANLMFLLANEAGGRSSRPIFFLHTSTSKQE